METQTPNPPSSSSLRVLIRPSSATTSTTTSSFPSKIPPKFASTTPPDLPSSNPTSSSSQSHSSEGVVVVGFIGRREDDVTHLINRILDDNVFGSGNLDDNFSIISHNFEEEVRERVKDWFRSRRISYYYEEEKGIMFLQFLPTWCPSTESLSESSGLDSIVEEQEFGDLQGMLFMFSVCHVIIFLQEGSHFDTQILKKLRMLQAAKHALAPFVKSHIKPTLTSKASSLSSSQPTVQVTSLTSSSGRGSGIGNRHTSAISLMSGLGSYSSLFPGQCTPVVLFVFIDDFLDSPNSVSHVEDSVEATSLNQSSNLSGLPRSNIPLKGSSSVVVLARPMSKSEGGIRKKIQSSLEAQIRFLIKKCRTLAGSEASHTGSRGGGNSSSAPLFSLEASRAVALLDRSTNQKGESLDFANSLMEEVLSGKATSDILLLEGHGQDVNKEDIQSIKEFIYRQSDTLRGRGGLVANANSGSAAGVGMVAVAAAAAAASAASGKPFTTPELPSLENWLSSSQLILDSLLSARRGILDRSDISKRKPLRRNATATQVERAVSGGVDPVESALSWLESGKGLNMKFSTSWCQRALPAAKDVYLKELPACYPTSLHEARLEKALRAFQSMVKGPAVQFFRKKLEDECASIWISGRQLCDAVSLTGKPCMHQRHNVEVGGLLSGAEVKPHSSGFVFLHACACGRSRRLRDDPFDFETANIIFNCFQNCDNLLPAFQPPKLGNVGPIQPSSWSLIRVGSARYYQPSKGLLQSGFCSTEKFLMKWSILLEKHTKTSGFLPSAAQKGSITRSNQDPKIESVTDGEVKKVGSTQLFPGEARTGGVEDKKKLTENISSGDQKISFGRGLPQFTMRRPFAEVVAGSVATDAAFPPLQQRKQPKMGSEKGAKQKASRDRSEEQVHVTGDSQGSQKSEDISSARESSQGLGANSYNDGEPFLQIGSYVVPMNMNGGGNIKSNTSLKHMVVYVGFEHECSYGHRFLLTSEHLNELGSLYSFTKESHIPSSLEYSDRKAVETLSLSKNGAHDKTHPHLNGMVTGLNKVRTSGKSNQNQHCDGLVPFSGSGNEQNQSSIGLSSVSKSENDLEEGLQYANLDDGGCALSLLNRNLPIYMNCPHCRISKRKKDQQKIKFASTVSQLQRIFVVTPPFPVVLATCPVIQFEASHLPLSVPDRERQSQFSMGCRVILPPDSFLTLRLPFVYGVQLEDRSLQPLNYLEHQPELTAWITKGTSLLVLSKGSSLNKEFHT